jgi:predicted ATPase
LIGRDGLISDLSELVEVAGHVTVVGLAGVGKTVLALTVGHRVAHRFPGGVGVLAVGDMFSEAQIHAAALSALRMRRADDLPNLLAEDPALLIVDAADRAVGAVRSTSERLRRHAATLHVLATSRHPLGAADEHVVLVPPLEVPPPDVDPAEVSRYPAAALFLARLRRVRQPLIPPDQARIVAALVRRLGGVPLALELAAARGRVLELHEMLARTVDEGGDGDPAGHQLRHAVLASWVLLTPQERAAMGGLATFQWRWSIEWAEELLWSIVGPDTDVVALLDRLMELGLVGVDPAGEQMRFFLLPAVRDVALEQTAQSGALARARDRHAAMFARLAARTAADSVGPVSASPYPLSGVVLEVDSALDHLRVQASTSDDDGPGSRGDLRASLERFRTVLLVGSRRSDGHPVTSADVAE